MTAQREGDREGADDSRNVGLTAAERELLLRACQRYKSGIPTYLKSREDERALLEALIQKLG